MADVNIKELAEDAKRLPVWRRHQYLVMVVGAVAIATVLVIISMGLYRNSDAMRLDLSRPGYQEVRSQVARDRDISTFSPTGSLTPAVIDSFNEMYDDALSHIHGVDAFRVDALSDDALSLPQITP